VGEVGERAASPAHPAANTPEARRRSEWRIGIPSDQGNAEAGDPGYAFLNLGVSWTGKDPRANGC